MPHRPLTLAFALLVAGMGVARGQAAPVMPGTAWTPERRPAATATPDAEARDAEASALLAAGPIGLAALTDFALRHNPSTRVAWAGAVEDLAGIDAARALYWPTVDATVPALVTRTRSHAASAAGVDVAAGDGTQTTFAPAVTLSWVLLDFGRRRGTLEAARWQAVASQLAYDRALQTVASSVEQAYYTLLGARQLDAALQLNTRAAQDSLDAAKARRSVGTATVGETSQAEATLADAQRQQAYAAAQARSAAGALAVAIGVPVATRLQLADDAVVDRLAPARGVDELLASARLSRADLVAIDAQVQQARALVEATAAAGRPVLSFGAGVGRAWADGGVRTRSQQVALTLTIPIFDGGLVRAQTRQAEARVEALAASRAEELRSIELDVWQSYHAAAASDAIVASAQAALRSAGVAEDAARARYRAGVGTLIELVIAQATSAQARVSLVQARYDGLVALARLGHAVGAGDGAAGVRANSSRQTDEPRR